MAPWRQSIAWRLTVLFAVVSAALLVAISSLLFLALDRLLAERDEAELNSKLELIRHHISDMRAFGDRAEFELWLADLAVSHPHLSVALFGGASAPLLAPRPFPVPRAVLDSGDGEVGSATAPKSWAAASGQTFLLQSGWSPLRGVNDDRVLVAVALDTSGTRALLAKYRAFAFAAVAAIAIFAVLMGLAVARIALRSLHRVAVAAGSISADRLNVRLGAVNAPSEAAPLVRAFDDALGRLEESFRKLSEFSSDLAHELRSPLHNIALQIQVVLSQGRSREDYRHVLETSLEDLQQLSRMVNDMLFLARADNGQAGPEAIPVDLRAELDGVVEFYDAFADERGVRIQCEGTANTLADRQLTRRAISNLLSNAIRHTAAGGTIRATAGYEADGHAILAISNPGPGISREHLGRLFDRFYRVDRIRGRTGEGAGLGLAIVRSIMLLHRGEVRVTSSPEGPTAFALRFPPGEAPGRDG